MESTLDGYGLHISGKITDRPRYYDVVIKKVDNGFIAQIGCKTFVAQKWEELSKGLAEYWKDPVKAQEKFCKE